MRLYGLAGLLLLIVSELGLYHRVEPFYSWFYCFAWWSYILLADNLLFRISGSSLLTTRRRELWGMLPLSVFVWLVFECYNLALRNWGYTGVPDETWLRWPGYAFAFSTVFPGVFITSDLVQAVLFGPGRATPASEADPLTARPNRCAPSWTIIGAVLSTLPIVWPRYFFPAVWVGPIFLLDPLLERLGVEGLLSAVARGRNSRVVSLLLGGLACGVMWEFWNFWAGSKWVYSIPFFGAWKIFEMPALGFLGFMPFALECWGLYHLLRVGFRRIGAPALRVALWAGMLAFCLLMFRAIDLNTVLRFTERAQ